MPIPPADGAKFERELSDLISQAEEVLSLVLVDRGETLSVAESCTGGYLCKILTDRSGSSRYFNGGCITYSNEAKTSLLRVDPRSIDRDGAVSESVTKAMAIGVARAFDAVYGVGISGVAGPTGGSPGKPVGTVWISVFEREASGVSRCFHFEGSRDLVRRKAVFAALLMLERFILSGKELDIAIN
jgi:PncC family amidohydrolase